ncbi:MAG: alginate export family protein [Cyclobacteriaceae bacterium]|nr:alginate export family protein [Cyclobacteriaceae bacterium]
MKTLLFRIVLFVLIGVSGLLCAQVNFSINGQYMNRAEYRHGFSTLAAADQDAAFFVSQRARVMTSLKFQSAEIYVSIQDIRTWGSTANAAIDNAGLLSVHEAWVALPISKKFALKMGRQEIAYDEDRLFGSLDWLMQARRHDAAIIKFYDSASNTQIHAGFAFNQDKEQLTGTIYTVPNNYKTFQYLYVNKPFGKIKSSFLFLNNGVQIQKPNVIPVEYTTVFTQTFGPRLVYKESNNKLSGNVAFYYQTGTNNLNQSLSGYDLMAELAYDVTKKLVLTGGFEILSGTDQINVPAGESRSFNPYYGTNHRFNGYMDYFYVGNHINSVGLNDYYIKGLIRGSKTLVGAAMHFFSAHAQVENNDAPGTASGSKLGNELDLTIVYKLKPGISFQGGYSQMFATQSMAFLKDVAEGHKQTNNWAYVMLILRPGVEWPRTGLKF